MEPAELLKEVEEEIAGVLAEGEPTVPMGGEEVPASELLGVPRELNPLTKSGYEDLILRYMDWLVAHDDRLMICDRGEDDVPRFAMMHKEDFTVEDFWVRRIAFREAMLETGLRMIEECRFAGEALDDIRGLPSSGS